MLLAENGADLKAITKDEKETALHILCSAEPAEKRSPNAAIIYQLLDVIRKKQNCENDDIDAVINLGDCNGLTPLMLATSHPDCDAKVVRVLVDAFCADVNSTDRGGGTALHHAAVVGSYEIAKALLDQPNIDINARDRQLATPLSTAVMHSQVDIVRLLLEKLSLIHI